MRARSDGLGDRQSLLPASRIGQAVNGREREGANRIRPRFARMGFPQGSGDSSRRLAIVPAELGEPGGDIRRFRAEQAPQAFRACFVQDAGLQQPGAPFRREARELALDVMANDLLGILDALRCRPQPMAERGAQRQADIGFAPQQIGEALMIEPKKRAFAVGDNRCGARLAGKQRHLSEAAAALVGGDADGRTIVLRVDVNAEAAFGDQIEAVARFALPAGRLAFAKAHVVEVRRELGQGDTVEARK